MSELIHNKGLVVLLPFATPHTAYKKWGVFHPACHLSPRDRKSKEFDETKDYSGFDSVMFATRLSHTVVATIPPKTTVVGMMLEELLATYVDPNNILAEIERVEHAEDSIASQVEAAFNAVPSADKILVVWPYQIFNSEEPLPDHEPGNYSFSFSHPMLNLRRDMIPEAIGISVVDESKEVQADLKDAVAIKDLDTLLKGSYTRILTSVEIRREDFDAHKGTPEYPDLVPLIKRTLAGKPGLLTNPNGHQFI